MKAALPSREQVAPKTEPRTNLAVMALYSSMGEVAGPVLFHELRFGTEAPKCLQKKPRHP